MNKKDILSATITKYCGEDIEDADLEQAVKKYDSDPASFTFEELTNSLKKCNLSKTQLDKVRKDLNQLFFWQLVDPNSYKSDQDTLTNYETDYTVISQASTTNSTKQPPPVEKFLLRCIIVAFQAEHDPGVIKASLEEFKKVLTQAEVKDQVILLKKAIDIEKRMIPRISKYLDNIANYEPLSEGQKDRQIASISIYENLIAIKKELIPIDTLDLCRLIAKTIEVERQIEAKCILLFIGQTGSGKTTTIKALLGYKMGHKMYRRIQYVTIIENVTDPKVLDMHSNPSSKSVTRYIVAVRPRQNITNQEVHLTDTPGFGDSAGVEVQLANIIGVKRALRRCKSVIPVIVIGKESWGPRGSGIKNLARTLSTLFASYRQCRDSVAIVMNRFTEREMEEMDVKIQNILDQIDPVDKVDQNYVSFLTHLLDLAKNKQLLTFDPMKDDPKIFLERSLLNKSPLKNPGSVFQNKTPPGAVIKTYATEIGKRVRYHMDKQNIDLVNYFLEDMEKLKDVLRDDNLETELTNLKGFIEQTVKDKFNKIISQFNSKIQYYSLDKADARQYFTDLKSMDKNKGYSKIISDCDFEKKGQDNCFSMLKSLTIAFQKERKKEEEEDSKNQKILKAITIIYLQKSSNSEFERSFTDTRKWLDKKTIHLINEYKTALEAGQYEKAAEFYQGAVRYQKYKPYMYVVTDSQTIKDNDANEQYALKDQLLQYVNNIIRESRVALKTFNQLNCSKLREADSKLVKVQNCHKLMSCQSNTIIEQISKAIKEFSVELKKLSDQEIEGIMKTLNDARLKSINKSDIDRFTIRFQRLNLLTDIQSIRSHIESQNEQINYCLQSYMSSQKLLLGRVKEMIENNNPQQLKNHIEGVQTALDGLESLSKFGGEKMAQMGKNLIEEILKQLRDITPKIVDGLSNNVNLKYNSKNCEDTLKKMADAQDMQEFFGRLKDFKQDSDHLRQRNQKNESLVKIALNEANNCIHTLEAEKDETTTQGVRQKKYGNISLNNIEAALKFVQIVGMYPHFQKTLVEGQNHNIKNIQMAARMLIVQFKEYLETEIRGFLPLMTGVDKNVKNLAKKQQTNVEVNKSTVRDMIGDRCREVWRRVKKCLQQVRDIDEKCPLINDIGNFNVSAIVEDFQADICSIYERLNEEWIMNRSTFNSYEQLSRLVKKCDIFKDDAKIIGETIASGFADMRNQIRSALSETQRKTVTRVEEFLKNKSFEGLNRHMTHLKANHAEDTITYEEANYILKNFIDVLLKDKRNVLLEFQEMDIEHLDLKKIRSFVDEMNELEEFLKLEIAKEDISLKDLLDRYGNELKDIMSRITEDLNRYMQNESIGEALRLVKELDSLQKLVPDYLQNQDKKSAREYEKEILEKLDAIRNTIELGNLKKEDFDRLKRFFDNSLSKTKHERLILELYGKWQKQLIKTIQENTNNIREAPTRRQLCKQQQKTMGLIKLLPKEEADAKKIQLDENKKLADEEIEKKGKQLEETMFNLAEQSKLSFESIKPQLDFLQKEPNERIIKNLKRLIGGSWETKKAALLRDPKCPIKQYMKVYIAEINPLVAKGLENEIIRDACTNLKTSFKAFFAEEIERRAEFLKEELLLKRQTDPEKSRQKSEQLTNTINDIFETMTGEKYPAEVKSLRQKLVEIYVRITKIVLDQYEKASTKINVTKMFEGQFQGNTLENFEAVSRIGGTIEVIRSQLTNKVAETILKNDLINDMRLKVETLPQSREVIGQFVEKMKNCQEFVKKFDIMSEQYDNADENQFAGSLGRFKTNSNTAKAYGDIYKLVTNTNIDVKQFEQKLNKDIETIHKESKKAVQDMDTEYSQKVLQKLNRQTIILNCFEKTFTDKPKLGRELKNDIENKIKQDFKNCFKTVGECKEVFKQVQDSVKQIKNKQEDELQNEIIKAQKERNDKLKKPLEDLDTQIAAETDLTKKDQLEKQKQTQIGTMDASLKDRIRQITKNTKLKYSQQRRKNEKKAEEQIAKISKALTRLKTIETDLNVAKDQCQKSIKNCLDNYKVYGKKFNNLLAAEFEKIGVNEANLVLKDNPELFGEFNTKRFRNLVQNNGPDYVVKKLRSQNLTQAQRDDILYKYQQFKKHYNMFTDKYSKLPQESTIKEIKDIIVSKASETARQYAKGRAPVGFDLLAEIFAMWSIMNASVSDNGVEYNYDPHPAQVIAMFLILGICGDTNNGKLGNRLAEVLTGEGKSVVLAGLSSYLALAGFDINCMCYSRMLSRRDYADFERLFDALNIKDFVLYGTFGEITEKLFNSNKNDLRHNIKEIYLNDKNCQKVVNAADDAPRRRILLVDEVDVFFAKDFFGKYYTPSTNIKHKLIEDLTTFVWNNRDNITYDSLINSNEFKQCVKQFPRLENILKYTAADMVSSVKNFKHDYILHQGRIAYVLPEGVSFNASYGWKTVFAYYFEVERKALKVRPQDFADISILCCEMSYAELPKEFDYIMGVTGTLQILPTCQKEVLKNWYRISSFYYMPSVYGESRRKRLGARVIPDTKHTQQICNSIQAEIAKKRPVIIFFATIDKMNEFYLSIQFKPLRGNVMTVSEKNDPQTIKDRVVRATRPANITLMSRAFGRGTDFVVEDKRVKQAGGLHVIQTFISEEESESVQVEGRTARQGQVGTYELFVSEDNLKNISLPMKDVEGKDPLETAKIIASARNQLFEKTYSDQIQAAGQCRKSHENSKKILEYIAANNNNKVREQIDKLNKFELPSFGGGKIVRTVIGIDATGSMSQALSQVLSNIKACLERTIEILNQKGVKNGFEIQIAVYRNYGSNAELLFQYSPFSTNAADLIRFLTSVKASGGQGNQAVETLYNHVLNVQKDVNQLIVIGDAAGNTMADIINKRQPNREDSYWKTTKFASILNPDQLLQQLVAKKVPVHNFYITKYPELYFQNISKMTGGECKEYKYNEPNAAKLLTDFIVQNILNKIGGKELVNAYRMRFGA